MVKCQDIGENNGNLNRKCWIFILFFLCIINNLKSQEIFSHGLDYQFNKDDIVCVCIDFLKNYADKRDASYNKHVILIDYAVFDSIDNYVVTENFEINNLYCKRPEAYLYCENKLVIVYTKYFSTEIDTLWYRKILKEVYNYYDVKNYKNQVNMIIRDSINKFTISSDTVFIFGNRHFNIVNYKIKNRKILYKKKVYQLLYDCEKSKKYYYN